MPSAMAKLRSIVDPGAMIARRDVRLIGGGLLLVAAVVLALRVYGIGFDRMATWLPAVVGTEKAAPADTATVAPDLPADSNVVPPADGDPDAPPVLNVPDSAGGGQPASGDVIPPEEP